MLKNFEILATSLSGLHNYFDSSTKFFLDLYQIKFLGTLAEPFFPWTIIHLRHIFGKY